MSRPQRVVLTGKPLFLGALASLLALGCAMVLVNGLTFSPWTTIVLTVVIGAVPAFILAGIFGLPLALLLEPIRNQWLHVAAFGGLGCVLGLGLMALTASDGRILDPGYMASAALMLGASMTVGRLSVWRLARTDDDGGRPACESRPPAVAR
ncbi:hypothetical protein [Pseudarthrobacter sp. N5]|uniref:hypothetical protein n=1 Tax=Pseudarthrobacter sp. N5 TaxID=3418416 RepID=UPI003CF74661